MSGLSFDGARATAPVAPADRMELVFLARPSMATGFNRVLLHPCPEADKQKVEERIAHNIEDQVRGLDEEEVEHAVKDKHEELLAGAKVKQHIPTLTEGIVRGEFRHRKSHQGEAEKFEKVLLAIDGSDESLDALDVSLKICRDHSAELVLMCVASLDSLPSTLQSLAVLQGSALGPQDQRWPHLSHLPLWIAEALEVIRTQGSHRRIVDELEAQILERTKITAQAAGIENIPRLTIVMPGFVSQELLSLARSSRRTATQKVTHRLGSSRRDPRFSLTTSCHSVAVLFKSPITSSEQQMKSRAIRGVVVVCLLVWTLQANAALKILITNDDGFETENIQALYHALVDAGHHVIMSAPYSGQSGTSGKIDFLQPILPTAEDSPQGTVAAGSPGVGATGLGLNQFYVDGTPAAAVLYGIDVAAVQVWGTFPDLVISGPNEGNNLGIVTPHSGTVGAAVTALNKGIPAIALSAESGDADAAEIVAQLAVKLVDVLDGRRGVNLPEGIGLNVNTPMIDGATAVADDYRFKLTKIGESANFGLRFYESLDESPIASAFGAGAPFPGVSLEIPATLAGYPEDNSRSSETNALQQGFVTVSPIQGTYAASNPKVRNLRGKLQPLFRKH